MNVILEDIAPCKKRLKIEVPSNRVQQTFDRVASDFQKEARIPGFRPGNAPKAMILKKYQKDIEVETQRVLVPEACQEAIRTKNLKVVSQPEIEDLNYVPGLSLSFSTVVELAPEFRLPNYKGLVLKKFDLEVTEEEVDKVLHNLAHQRATFGDAPDRPLEMEDFAVISYTGKIDETPLTEILPEAKNIGHNPNFWLWMREEGFIPKFAVQLVGMKRGEQRTIEIEFPTDFPQESVAGKKAVYEVSLTDIKIKVMPALDDAFAKELAGITMDELRQHARQNLEQDKKTQAHRATRSEVVQKLIAAVHFELPESVVEHETEIMVQDIVAENQERGIPASMMEERKEEIFQNATKNAREAVKFNFIASEIAEVEKIQVTNEELATHLSFMAQRENSTLEKIVDRVRKNNAFGLIQSQILRVKVLDLILHEAQYE